MPELTTDDQRWMIANLFGHLGCHDMEQMRADAMRILKLDYLPDLRMLATTDADRLISELRRALAKGRVSDD